MIAWVSAGVGLVVAASILLLIRRDALHVRHGIGWVLVALVFAGLGFSPPVVDRLAHAIGIAYPPVLALVLAIAALVIKILLMDIEGARREVELQRLVQKVAMLEADLHQQQAREPGSDA